ncbi:MAG TPA: non-canonical purine NTP pyrophosphatase [Patescibacteria group bacterium]
MKKILIGTGNQAKVDQYRELLKGFDLEVLSAKDLNIPAPEENAPTFEEEAINKAKYYFEKSGIPAIVDDGGFEIKALNGEPGVRSKRWIGREMSDEEIISEVIKRMEGKKDRVAKHTVVIAVATPFGVATSHAEIEGVVAEKPSDKKIAGFPYRSVLFLPNYKKYWLELSDQEEEIMNHRKHAIEKIKYIFKELSKD